MCSWLCHRSSMHHILADDPVTSTRNLKQRLCFLVCAVFVLGFWIFVYADWEAEMQPVDFGDFQLRGEPGSTAYAYLNGRRVRVGDDRARAPLKNVWGAQHTWNFCPRSVSLWLPSSICIISNWESIWNSCLKKRTKPSHFQVTGVEIKALLRIKVGSYAYPN